MEDEEKDEVGKLGPTVLDLLLGEDLREMLRKQMETAWHSEMGWDLLVTPYQACLMAHWVRTWVPSPIMSLQSYKTAENVAELSTGHTECLPAHRLTWTGILVPVSH